MSFMLLGVNQKNYRPYLAVIFLALRISNKTCTQKLRKRFAIGGIKSAPKHREHCFEHSKCKGANYEEEKAAYFKAV